MDTAFPNGGRGSVSGVGIGLRDPHFDQLMSEDHGVPWLELLADNFLARGGLTPRQLDRVAQRYPVSLHCVGMNLGGVDPLDRSYLDEIRRIADQAGAEWVSDHACFTAHGGRQYHDLLPLPYSDEAVRHIAGRVAEVQDHLGQRIAIENVSAYLRVDAPLSEAAFLAAVCDEADCTLLLDANNLYVNQVNLGLDARQAIAELPLERVREIHLAGYEDKGDYLIDAHNNRVSDPVWTLFAELMQAVPHVPVLIEWDKDIPPLATLLAEAERAGAIVRRVTEAAA